MYNTNKTCKREIHHGNGTSTVKTTTILQGSELGLNHGIAFHNGFLYASSPFTVYRWPYKPGQFSSIHPNTRQTVITNIVEIAGLQTRTLIFDDTGRLYISVGSGSNVDPNSYRSRIRRFNLEHQFLPIPFSNGETFADGLRNNVGLGFRSNNILYGVDNGANQVKSFCFHLDIFLENKRLV